MRLEVNDAGTLTGDDQGIDSHEEDIAKRQLWMSSGTIFEEVPAAMGVREVNFIINVNVKIILGHPKQELIMLLDSSANSRLQTTGYLRVLLKLP